MSSSHTTGPWTVNGGDDVWIGNRICIHIGDEDDANLIAAAPDLLAAVKAVIDFVDGKRDEPEPFGTFRSAYKKATGASNA